MVSRFVRKVRTASGAVAVQVVTRQGRQVLSIEHVGSAHTDEDLALLIAAARQRLEAGQEALDLGELAARPMRMGDVADWTLPVSQPSPGGSPRSAMCCHNGGSSSCVPIKMTQWLRISRRRVL